MDDDELFERARRFDTAWRGYDRGQVDRHIGALIETARSERRHADDGERRWQAALEEQRASDGEGDDGARAGWGARLEQVIEAAEREAAEIVDTAAREIAEFTDRARRETEEYRLRTQGDLDARAAELVDDLARQTEELDRREEEAEQILLAARADAERTRDAAARDEQARLAGAAAWAEGHVEQARDDVAAGRAAISARLDALAALRDLAGQQAEHLDRASGAEPDEPAGDGSDEDPVDDSDADADEAADVDEAGGAGAGGAE